MNTLSIPAQDARSISLPPVAHAQQTIDELLRASECHERMFYHDDALDACNRSQIDLDTLDDDVHEAVAHARIMPYKQRSALLPAHAATLLLQDISSLAATAMQQSRNTIPILQQTIAGVGVVLLRADEQIESVFMKILIHITTFERAFRLTIRELRKGGTIRW
jgi:hypothetical protein